MAFANLLSRALSSSVGESMALANTIDVALNPSTAIAVVLIRSPLDVCKYRRMKLSDTSAIHDAIVSLLRLCGDKSWASLMETVWVIPALAAAAWIIVRVTGTLNAARVSGSNLLARSV